MSGAPAPRVITINAPRRTGVDVSDTILCLTSFDKGQDFMRECAESGARTLLLTVDKLRHADWPRDVLGEVYVMPSFEPVEHVVNAVSYLARTERVARIVALDEFDMELAAVLREHLRVPGMGVTATRTVRDKLAMRQVTAAAGIAVPPFVGAINHDDIRSFLRTTRGPWMLKPRTQASAIGIHKFHDAGDVWPLLERLADQQAHHLIECFVPGDVYHVDGIVDRGRVAFAEVHRYAKPPFDVMHAGGIFCSHSARRGGDEEAALRRETERLVAAVGLADGAFHAEFIRAHDSGVYHFLEIAARVGGAHIADMVRAATGLNLWREWARLELARAAGTEYRMPDARREHAGVIISLARQEWPDTSAYDDDEVVWRLNKRHHAGLVLVSPESQRVQQLLDAYLHRFHHDFYASMPAPEKATD
jgi:biotin carboxylase